MAKNVVVDKENGEDMEEVKQNISNVEEVTETKCHKY